MMIDYRTSVFAVLSATVFAAAHGAAPGGAAPNGAAPHGAVPVPAGEFAPGAMDAPGAADTTFTIRTRGSNLDFEPRTISARHGTTITIRYINDGVLPHNLVVVRDEDDIDALGSAAYSADATGFVPVEHEAKMLAYTPLASPGDTVEVTFVMPPPGEYAFVCLVPGHYNMMIGTLRSLR